MKTRIRTKEEFSNAVKTAISEIRESLFGATNVGWLHDHIGVLKSTKELLEVISNCPNEMSHLRDLGRLVMDNDGVDFTKELKSLLLKISTANIQE